MIDSRYANQTIRPADKKYHPKKLYYDTDDIIDVMVWADKRVKKDTEEFARSISPDRQGMEELYDFLLHNIRYKADPRGAQWVKSPGRLWADREGDCKSFTLFIISVAQNLGLDYIMRFVNYRRKDGENPKHVYPIVILPDGQQIVMDVVYEAQSVNGAFDREKPYRYKIDHMRKGLAYLTGTEEGDQVLDAVANILQTIPASIKDGGDVTQMSEGELQRFLMAQRLETAAMQETRHARSQNLLLAASVVRAGDMSSISGIAGPEQGEVRKFLQRTRQMTGPAFIAPTLRFRSPPDISGFFDFFKKIGKGVADVAKGVFNAGKNAVEAVGDFFKEAWARLMNWIFKGPLQKSGPFFLFTYIKDTKGSAEVKRRQAKQNSVLGFFKKVGMQMSNIDAAIKNGILENLGEDPQALINKTAKGLIAGDEDEKKVGALSAIIAAVGFIIDIIKKIANLFKKENEQPAVTEGDTSDLELIEGLGAQKAQADSGGGGVLPWALGAGAALALFS